MKCDELKDRWFWAYPTESVDCDGITGIAHEVYSKSEVDEAIAELKSENERLKAKLENVQATAYADSVDAGMRERRLQRALYKACANWAMNARMVEIEADPWGENHESRLWAGVYDKCLKKAEQYR